MASKLQLAEMYRRKNRDCAEIIASDPVKYLPWEPACDLGRDRAEPAG